MGLFDIEKRDAKDEVPATKSSQPITSLVIDGKDCRGSAGNHNSRQVQLTKEGIEVFQTVVNGVVDIAKIREAGTQKVNMIKEEISKIIAESETRMREDAQKAQQWNDKFERQKNVFFEALREINAKNCTPDEKKLWIEVLKELMQK